MSSMSKSTYGEHDEEAEHIRWKERYRCKFDSIEVLNSDIRTCVLKLGTDSDTKIQKFHFESKQDVEVFLKVIDKMKFLQRQRAQRLTDAYKRKSIIASHPTKKGRLSGTIPRMSALIFNQKEGDHPTIPSFLESSKFENSADGPAGITMNVQEVSLPPMDLVVSGEDIDPEPPINILVEIVSASYLANAVSSSYCCCIVQDGTKEIHRTKRISNT